MTSPLLEKSRIVFQEKKGYARTRDLTAAGIHSAQIKNLENQGQIVKIKRGLYRFANYNIGNNEEFVEVSKIVPNGVICLLSALSYHGITVYQPWENYVAIHRDAAKTRLLVHPPTRIFYFSDAQYRVGLMEVVIGGHKVKMDDEEKTLCDCARYRHKLGKDVVKDGFGTYLRRPYRHVRKLLDYAKQTRVASVVSQYVEIML